MRVSFVGALRNAAHALDCWAKRLGDDEADDEDSDLIYRHQPAMMAHVLKEMADNAEMVRADPSLLDEFLHLYCIAERSLREAEAEK